MELLIKKEAEFKDLENSQASHIEKNEELLIELSVMFLELSVLPQQKPGAILQDRARMTLKTI